MKLTKKEKETLAYIIELEYERVKRINKYFPSRDYMIEVFSILNKVHEMETTED